MIREHQRPATVIALALMVFAEFAPAQCTPEWLEGGGLPGVNGEIDARAARTREALPNGTARTGRR